MTVNACWGPGFPSQLPDRPGGQTGRFLTFSAPSEEFRTTSRLSPCFPHVSYSWKSFESQHRHGTSLKENGGPKPAVFDPFSAMTRECELPADAPHDAALQPEVVLRSATEMSVKIIDLKSPQGDVTR